MECKDARLPCVQGCRHCLTCRIAKWRDVDPGVFRIRLRDSRRRPADEQRHRPRQQRRRRGRDGAPPRPTAAPPAAESTGLPVPPGAGIPRPSGTPGNVTVLNWAGFKSAVSYTFDDTNSSQISNYAALNALGVPHDLLPHHQQDDRVQQRGLAAGAARRPRDRQPHAQPPAAGHRRRRRRGRPGPPEQVRHHRLHDGGAFRGHRATSPLAATRYLINRGVNDGNILPNGNTDPFNVNCFVPAAGRRRERLQQRDRRRADGRRAGRPCWSTASPAAATARTSRSRSASSPSQREPREVAGRRLDRHGAQRRAPTGARRRCSRRSRRRPPGNSRTWTWTLPAHFPPGKVLRVRGRRRHADSAGRTDAHLGRSRLL